MQILKTVREKHAMDLLANGCSKSTLHTIKQSLLEPSVLLVNLIRICEWLTKKGNHKLCKIVWRCTVKWTGCYISPRSSIGGGVIFPHPIGIVIGENCRIGDNNIIYQSVTIGRDVSTGEYPTIEDKVTIYPNSLVIGGITIGRGSIIGAGSVVIRDIPPYSVVVGSPARVIRSSTP